MKKRPSGRTKRRVADLDARARDADAPVQAPDDPVQVPDDPVRLIFRRRLVAPWSHVVAGADHPPWHCSETNAASAMPDVHLVEMTCKWFMQDIRRRQLVGDFWCRACNVGR